MHEALFALWLPWASASSFRDASMLSCVPFTAEGSLFHGYTPFGLSIHLLMDILVVSSLGCYQKKGL